MRKTALTLEEIEELQRIKNAAAPKPSGKISLNEAKPGFRHPLLQILEEDAQAWLNVYDKVFTNERDLQVRLAIFLERTGHYDLVDTEYRVPLDELGARHVLAKNPVTGKGHTKWLPNIRFPWLNQMSVDLVVMKDGQWACIELKYGTHAIVKEWNLFGEPLLDSETEILKDQATSNLGMYGYWKDVRRIEMLTETFENVVGGLAIMVANSRGYWGKPRADAQYQQFSMHEGSKDTHYIGPGALCWDPMASAAVKDAHPEFEIRGKYPCLWHDMASLSVVSTNKSNPEKFRYMITIIY